MMRWINSVASWIGGLFGLTVPADPEQVKQIQAAAVNACNFLPMAETVVQIVGAASPGVLTATSAANYICGIVTRTAPIPSPQALAGSQTPPVKTWRAPDGTVIKGRFVK